MNTINRRQLILQLSASIPGVLSAATLAQLVTGCSELNETRPFATTLGTSEASSTTLNEPALRLINALSDIIIPKTDTPSASEAGVPAFIQTTVEHTFTSAENQMFIKGLSWLDALCIDQYKARFEELKAHQQQEFASAVNALTLHAGINKTGPLSKHALKQEHFQLATKCFATTKSLCIFGYCTSEMGATQHLNYQPVPGRFDACVPLESIGKAWATR